MSDDLTGNMLADVTLLLILIKDKERAVTDEEKAAAEHALQVELALQKAASTERARRRILGTIGPLHIDGKPPISFRGGPDLDADSEDEYRAEQADYDD